MSTFLISVITLPFLQLSGLTKETFLAVRQTCQALTSLSKHLFNKCGFKYVLLGKIQSDNIERRFGHIRQLSGANYFISMRQLLESDRKLRTISLLKYSNISVAEIGDAAKEKFSSSLMQEITTKAESLHAELLFNILPTDNDAAIIYYVTGYCCRSLVKSNRCNACKNSTIESVDDAIFETELDIPGNVHDFFREINRGGLWKPTSELFDVGSLCWRLFAEIAYTDVKKKFLSGCDQREVFKKLVSMAFYEGNVMSPRFVPVVCDKGHDILDGLAMRFFNCMMKNLVRSLSERSTKKVDSKIKKLTGKQS